MLAQTCTLGNECDIIGCYHNHFDSSPIGVFAIDQLGRFLYVNATAADMLGFSSPQEADGKPVSQLEFFFSTDVLRRLLSTASGGDPFSVDCFPGTNLSGHFAYYALSCHTVRQAQDQLIGAFGVISDVSDYALGRQQLDGKIEELSILSQIAQVLSSKLDTDDVLRVILTGVTARQGLGFNRAMLFLVDRRTGALHGRLAIGPDNAEEAGRIWSSLETRSQTLVDILFLYEKESAGHANSLMERIQSVTIDSHGESLFSRALAGKTSFIAHPSDELDDETQSILRRLGNNQIAMTPLISRDRPVGLLVVDNAITRKPITTDDLRFLTLIAEQTANAVERSYLYSDLREHAAEMEDMNRKLKETQNKIIEAEKMSVIGEITSAVAHELRNPLTIIGGFANLMAKNLPPDSPDTEYLNIIIAETQRAESVLTDVLDFSRASRTEDTRHELFAIIQQAVDMLRMRVGRNRVHITVSEPETPLPVWGNGDQLLHAIYQVMYTMSQSISETLETTLTCHRFDDTARVEIKVRQANGKREEIIKVLTKLFGGDKNTEKLPLLVAQETIKHHGGSLEVETAQEKTPILSLSFPCCKEEKPCSVS
jgi:PAS domain S-box-containing protein